MHRTVLASSVKSESAIEGFPVPSRLMLLWLGERAREGWPKRDTEMNQK